MFTEELNLIKETEENAEALRKSTKSDAKRLVEEAQSKAARILADAELQAKQNFDALVRSGTEIADGQYEAALAAAGRQCEEMADRAGLKEKDVIGTIVERIVKSSVNC